MGIEVFNSVSSVWCPGLTAQFTGFLAGVCKALVQATVEDLVEFSEHLHNKKLAAPTIKTYTATVKSLLSFAYKTGYISFNPGAAIKLKKIDQRLHEKVLTETDIAIMIRLTERAKKSQDRLKRRFADAYKRE